MFGYIRDFQKIDRLKKNPGFKSLVRHVPLRGTPLPFYTNRFLYTYMRLDICIIPEVNKNIINVTVG
jgi:hypothetical protein